MTVPTPLPPRRQRRLVLLVLVAGAFLARRYLVEIGPGLRPLSRSGIEGFLRYVCGDYTGTAAAYRNHLRDLFATAGSPGSRKCMSVEPAYQGMFWLGFTTLSPLRAEIGMKWTSGSSSRSAKES